MTKKFTPVLQHKFLTPFYNYILILSGLGPSFRRRIHTLSNLSTDKDIRLVDIGCGTGIDISLLNKRFPNLHLIGIDPDDQLVQQNKVRFQRTPNVQFKNGFAEALPIQDNSVDYAYSTLTFHHLTPNAKLLAINEIHRILKDNGMFILVDWGDLRFKFFKHYVHVVEDKVCLAPHFDGSLVRQIVNSGFDEVSRTRVKFSGIWLYLFKKRPSDSFYQNESGQTNE